MKLKRSLAACALLLCLMTGLSHALAQTRTHHVVFALTSGDEADWHLTLGNMRNLLTGFGSDPYEVELVAYGPGLSSVVTASSKVADDIKALQEKHVRFLACENSMRSRHVTADQLLPGVQTTPSGVAEVVSKQEQGWAYIKGGR